MNLNEQPIEVRRIFRDVAKEYDTTEQEIFILYKAVWKTVYSHMSSPGKMHNIYIKNWGYFRPYKKIREKLNDYTHARFKREELYELV